MQMEKQMKSEKKRVWFYVIWPPILLNIGGTLLIAGMYAYRYAGSTAPIPDTLQIDFSQTQFALSAFIFLVEWFFAGLLIFRYRKSNAPVRPLFSRTENLFRFRWGPAILLFVLFNLIFAAYIYYLIARMPELTYRGMHPLQAILFILLVPATAAFTEELIWRGHIITGFLLNGKSPLAAVLISALSFALIHGVFMPDKLLATFILGIATGVYYLRERNLFPLMITHWFVDVWGFGIFFLR
jgi:membrane protease YdiL (CAAX protease family)